MGTMFQPTSVICIGMLVCVVWMVSIDPTNSQLLLTTSTSEPVEGSSVSLTCNYTGSPTLPATTTWYKNGNRTGTIVYTDNDCSGAFEFNNYNVYCTSREFYTLTITSVQLDLHNTTWYCNRGNLDSNTVILRIAGETTVSLEPNNGHVIETGNLTLICSATGGQWHNMSQWRVYLNNTYYNYRAIIYNHTVNECTVAGVLASKDQYDCRCDGQNKYRAVIMNVDITRHQQIWTCIQFNLSGYETTSPRVIIHVHVPVASVSINKSTVSTIEVNENNILTIQCETSPCRPAANITLYFLDKGGRNRSVDYAEKTTVVENTLTITRTLFWFNASRDMNGWIVRCIASNIRNYPEPADIVKMNVTYPPLVNIPSHEHLNINESEPFVYSCPVIKGNPSSTTVIWRRTSDNRIWNSRELLLPIVSRYDESVYTCNASNVMTDSAGTTRFGNSSGYIILIVQFQTNVTHFFIQGHAQNTSVVVMEDTHLTFECHVQSKPTSDIRILEKNMTVKRSYDAKSSFYHTTASCSGKENVPYSCHGENLLSTKPSTRDVFLTVNCKPRADTNAIVHFIVATAINKTVTMSYTVLAYPPPLFVWYRNGSTIDTSDPRTNVSSSKLQTHLTITHVEESDFGEYTLSITNDIGSIIASLYLKPEEHEVHSLPYTSHNVSAIVGGVVGGLVIVCTIVVIVFIYRRRFVKHNQPESSSDPSLPPVTYENLKIEQIPKVPIEHERDTFHSQPSETNSDNAYEGLSRQDNDKENQYTQLDI